ncbi:DeoR family transcriptional regulator [Paractinoplanes abujensis]|uniref:DeoR family glycerol-3-phosphate regulon repressor/DeoR family fructose operon transcriptional repressor n=1 Tax=Paractinoplanes abujensis TaxID=882441 RepID=A0A7W7CMZ3_9ACTN|nr:DeoR/GlpR family DNA-binding transcription regulator [Actinoplanes abujensis]MBB4691527.1 DeoR family glycerol-3-phosphate regulon repressor/DeoR family fructose operon transcriptional repressor [Actinoplanes abujensis]GID17056.1 DeoR family transcriptional regulator [Actinoplanes abujensis]
MSVDKDERQRHLPAGRKAQLAAYVAEAGQVTVSALAERFGVSIDTVRRDLDQLSADGVLVRTYGGAVSRSTLQRTDRAVDQRLSIQEGEKEQIAQLAAALVDDGSTIMINGGTTTLALARGLSQHRELTVATNNLLVPAALPASAIRDIYVFGGAVRALTLATIGPVSFRANGGAELDIRCDLALIGVGAIAADAGYTTSNLAEAAMMQEMISRADRVAILADSSKFGRRLFAQVSELSAADYLVTDAVPPPALRDALEAAEVELITPGQ